MVKNGFLPKNFLESPLFSYTVKTPGARTPNVGTWLARTPIAPLPVGTSTCFTSPLFA